MANIHAQAPNQPNIQPWILERVTASLTDNVRFEVSLYGPLTSLMSDIFPSHRQFMIKPQGLLRREHDGEVQSDRASIGSFGMMDTENDSIEDADKNLNEGATNLSDSDGTGSVDDDSALEDLEEFAGNISIDSYAAPVSARSLGQVPKGHVGYVDFIIVKATRETNNDTIVAVIEVKLTGEDFEQSALQLQRYMGFAASKSQRDPNLLGFLIVGEMTHVFELAGPDYNVEPRLVRVVYPTDSDAFRNELHSIAILHWL